MDKPTEKDYEELERLGAKLHIATPTAKWGFKLEKQDSGEVLYETTERAHSWVRNAYTMLISNMCADGVTQNSYGTGVLGIKSTGATAWQAANGAYSISPSVSVNSGATNALRYPGNGFVGAAGSTTNGIVIGTGTAAYSFDDYKLASMVSNGNGTGQMAYSAGTGVDNWDSTNKIYTSSFVRIINNNSGADIVINEVGIIMNTYSPAGYYYNCLMVRDLLETPITVPTDSKLTITYNMQTLFPA